MNGRQTRRTARAWARAVRALGAGGVALVASSSLLQCNFSVPCEDTATCHEARDAAPDADASAEADAVGNVLEPDVPEANDSESDAGAIAREAGRDARALDAANDVVDGAMTSVLVDARLDVSPPLPPSCDGTKAPGDDNCVIDAKFGVFVSPLGDDLLGTGGESTPYKTIGRALAVAGAGTSAGAQRRRVYVCATAGSYDERVAITAGAALFGGFDCSGPEWKYLATRAALVRPTVAGVTLTISGAQRVELENIAFDAKDATEAGGSSVTALVNGAAQVVLRRVTLVAGNGRTAPDAASASNYTAAVATNGESAVSARGGAQQSCLGLCMSGAHATGGKGGSGGTIAPAQSGSDGTPKIAPPDPVVAIGAGGSGDVGDGNGCANGKRGSNAPSAAGGVGATKWGALLVSGWMPATAASGGVGGPGQGGGGGGGGVVPNTDRGGGSGGGCGGCGGGAGAAGLSGGSSFALLSYQSVITLEACVLTAGAGGSGSKGADGQPGQLGGLGGVPNAGCSGGQGGQGGQGGGGGGGAAGISVAIAYAGPMPSASESTIVRFASTPALGGAPGAGGTPPATKGRDGIAQGFLELAD